MTTRSRLTVAVAASTLAGMALAGAGTPAQAAPSTRADAVDDARANVAAAASSLGVDAYQSLVVQDVVLDTDGRSHVRFQRTWRGLPVLGGDLVVHQTPAGSLRGTDRASAAAIGLPSATPTVTAQQAAAAAAGAVSFRVSTSAPELAVYALRGAPRLVWKTAVDGVGTQDQPAGQLVVVDAHTAAVTDQWPTVLEETGTGNSLFLGPVSIQTSLTGGQYTMVDATRGGGRTEDGNNGSTTSTTGTLLSDADNVWGNGSTSSRQSAAVDAHAGVAATWDYYTSRFGRSGIKNDGRGARSIVHVGTNWVNASWSDACFCMRYGDGDGVTYAPLVSLDVAGHEMTHGVTSAVAGLVYRGESGGLNEATSDIFGTMVEFAASNANDPADYFIGERFALGSTTPLRYMDSPIKDGSSPNCYSKSLGRLDVHYSSGVANHFFYLLAEGSGAKVINGVSHSSPTCNGSVLGGIGRAASEQIWYRALDVYMTSSTGYSGARTATLNAARDLYGTGSAQYNAVAAAWTAVSVR